MLSRAKTKGCDLLAATLLMSVERRRNVDDISFCPPKSLSRFDFPSFLWSVASPMWEAERAELRES